MLFGRCREPSDSLLQPCSLIYNMQCLWTPGRNMSGATQVPSQLLLQNVPEEPPSWESSEDVLALFDDLLESMPGPSVSSNTLPTANDMLAALSEPTGSSILTAEEPVNRKSSLRSRPPRDSRKQQNSQAQRRFRQRQKVSSPSHLKHAARARLRFGQLTSLCPRQESVMQQFCILCMTCSFCCRLLSAKPKITLQATKSEFRT